MKLKELKKVLAFSVAASMAVPGNVWAAAPGDQLTPGAYEAETGNSLPNGYHYILDENGFVMILDNGSAAIEADETDVQEPPEEGTEESVPETPEEGTEESEPETPEEGTENPTPETPEGENPEETTPEVPEGEGTDTETPEGGENGETPEKNCRKDISMFWMKTAV